MYCERGEAKFWLEPTIELAQNSGMAARQIQVVRTLISGAEVTNLSGHGFWLLVADEELFISFKEFPWFKDAFVSEILNVEWSQPHHLYWPSLDVDLAVESIRHPEKFPLISKDLRPTKRTSRHAGGRR